MTIYRQIIRLFDRPGLRHLLGFAATAYARHKTGLDVRIFYNEAWTRRIGTFYLAESATFDWSADNVAGWRKDLDDVLHLYRGWWFHQYKPKEGDVIVDIGAGIGDDAIVFSHAVGQRGRILSVEAHPATFRLLQKNCRYNRLENVTALHQALMDKTCAVAIETRSGYQANTISQLKDNRQSSLSVPACSLDELCARQKIDHIDFLKMNIEGAERFAIKGMPRMIGHISQLCIACHDFIGEHNDFYRTKGLVVDFLKSNGFEVSLRENHPDPWVRDHVYGKRLAQI
jgi:FkbM family methyltransferase